MEKILMRMLTKFWLVRGRPEIARQILKQIEDDLFMSRGMRRIASMPELGL
jgi:hypothetical protein